MLAAWRTNILPDGLTVWLIDWSWLADWLTDWLTDWLADWLPNFVTDWLTNWLTGWLNDWLTCWPTNYIADSRTDFGQKFIQREWFVARKKRCIKHEIARTFDWLRAWFLSRWSSDIISRLILPKKKETKRKFAIFDQTLGLTPLWKNVSMATL